MNRTAIRFLPWNRACESEGDETLLEIAIEQDIPLPHACGGDAACSTCAVEILEGMECLGAIEELERDALDKFLPGTGHRTRLSCQAPVVKEVAGRIIARSLESDHS